jgi:transposase
MAAFLARHAYSGRRSPGDLLARLRGAPAGHAGGAEEEASGAVVVALAAALERLIAGIAALADRTGAAVAALPEGRVVMSFPRAGTVCAAQIVAELGDVRERFPSADVLAVEAGVAPVTRQSGRSRSVVCRWACNRRLRAALTVGQRCCPTADNSRHASDWAAGVYGRARDRGCDHPHAVRILARAWARVLWRAWRDGKPYDPQAHAGARALASA